MMSGQTICDGHAVILSFTACTVTFDGKILFEPGWGTFDMAVGTKIVSVYSGPADPDAFGLTYPAPDEKTHKIVHTEEARELQRLYRQVRDIREQNCSFALLPSVWEELKLRHPSDWLCALEILELLKAKQVEDALTREVTRFLLDKRAESKNLEKLIDDGLAMI
jgi:phenylalanine-4-hydroxylase